MGYRRFAAFNVVGGIGWVVSMTFTGYFLVRAIPGADKYLHVIILIVVFLSILPGIIAFLRSRLGRAKARPAQGEVG
jgi:membrane-associated protein